MKEVIDGVEYIVVPSIGCSAESGSNCAFWDSPSVRCTHPRYGVDLTCSSRRILFLNDAHYAKHVAWRLTK